MYAAYFCSPIIEHMLINDMYDDLSTKLDLVLLS